MIEEETIEGWTKLTLDQLQPGAILGYARREDDNLIKVHPFAVVLSAATLSELRFTLELYHLNEQRTGTFHVFVGIEYYVLDSSNPRRKEH